MYKKLFISLAAVTLAVPVIALGIGNGDPVSTRKDAGGSGNAMEAASNQYTQPEGTAAAPVSKEAGTFEGYTKAAENEEMILYVNEDSLALKVKNKRTGYVWNSGLDQPGDYRLNKTWEEFAQSALTIDYVDKRGKTKTESILTNQSKPQIRLNDSGFSAKVYFFQSKINVTVEVKIEGDQLTVSIPDDQVKEGKRNQLISMNVYPFLGAVKEDEVGGYMFIPDGSGALIRYQKAAKKVRSPYIQPIFGRDEAFTKTTINNKNEKEDKTTPLQEISAPVFGAVHGVKQNGFFAIVEGGNAYADIMAYPAGVATEMNWIGSKFHYRYEYYQPTSKNMKGINLFQKKRNAVDIKLRYTLLGGKEADYVGMARQYQEYLKKQKVLGDKKDKASVRLEFLGGEVKKGLLWDSVLPMTPVSALPKFTKELQAEGVSDFFMVYRGWSKGGLTGSLPAKFPVEGKIGSAIDVSNTIQLLQDKGIPLYFHSDYTKAYEGAGGYAGRKDVANKISSETISQMDDTYKSYFLAPEKTLEIAKDDREEYRKLGMEHLAIETTGSELFSDYNKNSESSRMETMDTYRKAMAELKKNGGSLALYEPNVYAWKGLDKYFDIPMNSSSYMFVTDTVPFLQIVLKGYVPYYAPFSNFHADQEDDILRMVEYGAYPSFYLTEQSSTMLSKTPSKDLFTSKFSSWKKDIIREHKLIEDMLSKVEGAEIIGRTVPAQGIAEVSYSNGKRIIVNYTDKPYKAGGITVDAKGYTMTEGGEEG